MATGLQVWSKTAASNSSADSTVNWAEGMAPSAVNDSARGEMAAVAKWRDDNNGSLAGTLSTATYSVTSNQVAGALTAGYTIAFQLGSAMPATALLNLDTLGAKPLRPTAGVDFAGSEYPANAVIRAAYFTSNSGEWIIIGHRELGSEANAVVTANITNAAVTYAKIQNVTNNRLLGNFSGSGAAPSEYSITGPTVSGSAITFPFPVQGSFKNLSIKVASNTTVTVAADFVTTTDGTNYQSTAVSGTINLGTNGAVNALDTGTIAIDTWYAIWVIAKADGTTGALASASFTSPTMPTGYTYKARVGAVQTIHGSATLWGTWQFGRKAQYVLGLAQTTALPNLITGSSGSTSVPTWSAVALARYVPTTASRVQVTIVVNNGSVMVAPNNSYGGIGSATIPGVGANTTGIAAIQADYEIESANIYYAGSSASSAMVCNGWEDNL